MMKVNILETDTGCIREDELRDWSQAALNQLDKAYGYKSFRPGQLEAVNTILNDRDLIAVMPTGSGKSVCYQLPAMREGHLALVIHLGHAGELLGGELAQLVLGLPAAAIQAFQGMLLFFLLAVDSSSSGIEVGTPSGSTMRRTSFLLDRRTWKDFMSNP